MSARTPIWLLITTLLALVFSACADVDVRGIRPVEDESGLPLEGEVDGDETQDAEESPDEEEEPSEGEPDPGDDAEDPEPDPNDGNPPGGDPGPPPDGGEGGETCQSWAECAVPAGDPNSGFQCVSGQCVCDADGSAQAECASNGGEFVTDECRCVFSPEPYPSEYPGDNCYWHWEEPVCDPDRWVDTSYYTEECYYDSNDYYVCNTVYVEDGYWEPGYCPSPYWEQRCT
jgi:hypothetical protein